LKSLTTRHTRSSGALITVLTKAFGISSIVPRLASRKRIAARFFPRVANATRDAFAASLLTFMV
jgi:hypothetical protein